MAQINLMYSVCFFYCQGKIKMEYFKQGKKLQESHVKARALCITNSNLGMNLKHNQNKVCAVRREFIAFADSFFFLLFSNYRMFFRHMRHFHPQYTSVLKQLCHLVLGSSRNTMKWAKLGHSLHKVFVLTVQSSYSHSCHCKVLETIRCKR